MVVSSYGQGLRQAILALFPQGQAWPREPQSTLDPYTDWTG